MERLFGCLAGEGGNGGVHGRGHRCQLRVRHRCGGVPLVFCAGDVVACTRNEMLVLDSYLPISLAHQSADRNMIQLDCDRVREIIQHGPSSHILARGMVAHARFHATPLFPCALLRM